MRGFGQTEAPPDVADYSLLHLVGDLVGLVAALNETQAIVVGHDWGAPVAWTAALTRPDIFRAVAGLSVPHRPRGPASSLGMLRQAGLHNHYWIYFQTPGVAEAEFERDPDFTIRRLLYGVPDPGADPVRDNLLLVPEGGGFLSGLVVPPALPAWLREEDLTAIVNEYRRTGFRGGLNWYRNIDRNWALTAPWTGARIDQPALFIAGTQDPVIAGPRGEAAIEQMKQAVPKLRLHRIEGAGHWLQQERPQEVNAALAGFLAAL
jgi:pimeloyl-ACP methyl ester carboxylesterase